VLKQINNTVEIPLKIKPPATFIIEKTTKTLQCTNSQDKGIEIFFRKI
jgi:hypothetical protein